MKRIFSIYIVVLGLAINPIIAQQIKGEHAIKTEIDLKHYMPLYLDVPAELNVKKGYQEINVASGYADYKSFTGVRSLLEYDFAPINKLGIEIELPFTFVNSKQHAATGADIDGEAAHEEGGNLESAMGLRVGFNYSFLTLPKPKITFAAGYFNEIETSPFKEFGKPVFVANVYNPFIVIAKIWGERFHTLIYTGPSIKQEFANNETNTQYRVNTTLSYRLGNKETFGGVEINQSFGKNNEPELVLRPQLQLYITEKWKLGLVAGIPVKTSSGLNSSGFFRLIYSP